MAASRRSKRPVSPSKSPPQDGEIITMPAPAATTTAPAPVPASDHSPEAEAIRRSVIPKSARMPAATVIAAIHSLLEPQNQERLLEGGVAILSEHLLIQLDNRVKLTPEARVRTIRKQLKDCVELGALQSETKKALHQVLDNYFDAEERQLIKGELQGALDFRKLSRKLAVDLNLLLRKCIEKLDQENIPHISTYIYINIPKPTPDNLSGPGIGEIFIRQFKEFFEENLYKTTIQEILESIMNAHPTLFRDKTEIVISDEIFILLATHTWKVIQEGLSKK